MRGRLRKITGAALQGMLLLRLGADKYLPQIIYFFFMSAVFIGVNLGMEKTIHQKEENKKILENLKSMHTEYTCRLTSLNSVCKVEEMLHDQGSMVGIPLKQAERLNK